MHPSTSIPAVPPAAIEIWFEFGSNYSYLSVMRIAALCARHALHRRWRPFRLGPIFKHLGWEASPFVTRESKGRYVWRDMERQCEKYGLAWRKPSRFPRRVREVSVLRQRDSHLFQMPLPMTVVAAARVT